VIPKTLSSCSWRAGAEGVWHRTYGNSTWQHQRKEVSFFNFVSIDETQENVVHLIVCALHVSSDPA
jgi:hypothetical protein